MKKYCFTILLLCLFKFSFSQPYIIVLGVAQDGGYPQMGCTKKCCAPAWANDSLQRYVVSFALVDSTENKWWLFEATPDIKYQLQLFWKISHAHFSYLPAGIFITHAHIGHYTGLMQLGKEVMNTKAIPVYVLPRMALFLKNNGPWSQLVKLDNIEIHVLKTDSGFNLNENIRIETFTVPHRDEYSETAGFKIITSAKKYLFIPDIDRWEQWNKNIVSEVKTVDVALLDATFYSVDELPGTDMSKVPHPLIPITIDLFKNEDAATKAKVHFIHFNHTNPMLWDKATQQLIIKQGFDFAVQGERL